MVASTFPRALPCVLCGLAVAACQRLPDPLASGSATGTSADTAASGTTFDDTPPTVECDPGDQDCPDGEKCTAVAAGTTRNRYACVADPGQMAEGEACTKDPDGVDGCIAGTLCVEDRLGAGRCLGICLDDGDCNDGRCTDAPFDDVEYCARTCDPLASACPSNMACTPTLDAFICTFPYEDDTGSLQESCNPFDGRGCAPGLTCLAGSLVPSCGEVGCCTIYCNVNDPQARAGCQSALGTVGVDCVPFFSGPAPGFEHVGVCMVPA